mmetsp:Transcript_9075/g.13679  ORF Transcript_9075/g.13679 Transcript_9075/m.13679 type:complete len:312 (+) Transcript_9075:56-991(+)
MSPQFRATIEESTTFASNDDGRSGNPCSDASSAANMGCSLHKIESESSATAADLLAHQLQAEGISTSSRKRSSARISLSPKNQPSKFLSSYGSAFLSGIFADIAVTSDDPPQDGPAVAHYDEVTAPTHDSSSKPCPKKARTTASTSFGRQPKSHMALPALAEGAISEALSPSVVSPRPNTSTYKNQDFNDQVRELQDMAFPSLPQLPITVSSSSCSAASWQALAPNPSAMGESKKEGEQDSPSYGWFVSADDDKSVTADQSEPYVAPTFLPDTKPDLAFKALTAPHEGNQDLVVQQALAADTIDDVLGDLF